MRRPFPFTSVLEDGFLHNLQQPTRGLLRPVIRPWVFVNRLWPTAYGFTIRRLHREAVGVSGDVLICVTPNPENDVRRCEAVRLQPFKDLDLTLRSNRVTVNQPDVWVKFSIPRCVASSTKHVIQQPDCTLLFSSAVTVWVAADDLNRIARIWAYNDFPVTPRNYVPQLRQVIGKDLPEVPGIADDTDNPCRIDFRDKSADSLKLPGLESHTHDRMLRSWDRASNKLLLTVRTVVSFEEVDSRDSVRSSE